MATHPSVLDVMDIYRAENWGSVFQFFSPLFLIFLTLYQDTSPILQWENSKRLFATYGCDVRSRSPGFSCSQLTRAHSCFLWRITVADLLSSKPSAFLGWLVPGTVSAAGEKKWKPEQGLYYKLNISSPTCQWKTCTETCVSEPLKGSISSLCKLNVLMSKMSKMENINICSY